ncbi:MAG: helix-turn-helix domain-containing protein [Peptoniphilaceae bacterium]|nr:helix-turn-helix domain-containing protein [Peptoniphilaceae bacterium]MDD7542634.1 helix-turn-helix transcriptional regulator [Peptoniphilaceae bacterium]MDY5766305.1 helix-turn-helix transcriptional regulator [Peptoniphilaceae bacterium]
MILADKIIELRKKNNWSQEELAAKLGVSRQAISKWESAQSIPDLERILKMSALFGVSTDTLIKDEIELSSAPINDTEDSEHSMRVISM